MFQFIEMKTYYIEKLRANYSKLNQFIKTNPFYPKVYDTKIAFRLLYEHFFKEFYLFLVNLLI